MAGFLINCAYAIHAHYSPLVYPPGVVLATCFAIDLPLADPVAYPVAFQDNRIYH